MTSLTQNCLDLFLDYAEDAANWNGTPLVSGPKSEAGMLIHLKMANLIKTFEDEGCTWIVFTDVGREFALKHGVQI